jgi:transposase
MISDLKRKVLTLLDLVFPEYASVFSDTFSHSSLELLSICSTPEDIIAIDTDKLCKLLSIASRGRFSLAKAEQIKSVAQNSFGALLNNDGVAFMLKQFVEQIKFLDGQLSDLEGLINSRFKALKSPITTIPGIGNVLGAAILAEVGDIRRFESPEKLAAFAGIDPSVNQSGQFSGTRNHMSKKGSSYLRRSIWLAAISAINNDPAIRAFYEIKKSQGKHHFTCVGYICRKMVNIIFAVLNSGEPYHPVFPKA